MKRLLLTIIAVVTLFTSTVFGEAPFIVQDKEIKFVKWVYTLSKPLTDKEKMQELRSTPAIVVSNQTLWVLETADRTAVQDKLKSLVLGYKVVAATATAAQQKKKISLDGQYWTKEEVINAGMPTGVALPVSAPTPSTVPE